MASNDADSPFSHTVTRYGEHQRHATVEKPLRILVQNRPDSAARPGGDTVQMEETVRFLRACGHAVDVSFDLAPELHPFDVVHLFNLTRPIETWQQAQNALRQNKPYVLSPVYWDLDTAVPWYAYEFPRNLWRRFIPLTLRKWLRTDQSRNRKGAVPPHPPSQPDAAHNAANINSAPIDSDEKNLQYAILKNARLIFPNSRAEQAHILECFPILDANRFIVVYNGTDVTPTTHVAPAMSRRESNDKTTFICAGAIGPRKNQLNLVKAFHQLPSEHLTIYGQTALGAERYHRAIERAAPPNVKIANPVPHEEMVHILASAKALVQPSFIETPGLSAMEALAANVPIVVADVPPVREYFGDLAHFCDPAKPESIAAACRRATAAAPFDSSDFRRRYSWNNALAPLANAYQKIL